MMRLHNKVAVITGAGMGMGRAAALRFAQEGAKVVVAELNADDGQATAATIRERGGDALFVRVDVAQASAVQSMVEQAVKQYGRIDVLYNNAAVQLHNQDARAHELSEEIWDRTHAVNLRGLWLCAKYVLPVMLGQHAGSIINAASPTALSGCAPGYTAYSSSKGGVIALTRVMAVDYARDTIRVNAIVPGATETPLISALLADDETRARLVANVPMGRLGTVEDVAELVLFLASDESRFCTGGVYPVDGGQTAA